MRFFARAFCCLACIAAGGLMASDASSQIYVGGGVGQGRSGGSLGLSPLSGSGGPFGWSDRDTGYKLYGGYQFTPRWGLELGYNDLGQYSAEDTCLLCASTDVVRFNLSNAYAAGTVTWKRSDLSFLLKFGVVRNTAKGITFCNPACVPSGNDTRTQLFAGFGLEYPVAMNLAARFEYEHYGKVTGDDVYRKWFSHPVTADSLSLSLKYAF